MLIRFEMLSYNFPIISSIRHVKRSLILCKYSIRLYCALFSAQQPYSNLYAIHTHAFDAIDISIHLVNLIYVCVCDSLSVLSLCKINHVRCKCISIFIFILILVTQAICLHSNQSAPPFFVRFRLLLHPLEQRACNDKFKSTLCMHSKNLITSFNNCVGLV